MEIIGTQEIDVTEAEIYRLIGLMKTRGDYLDLTDRFNWGHYHAMVRNRIGEKLTKKQFTLFRASHKDLKALDMITKRKKLLAEADYILRYHRRVEIFCRAVNKHFGLEGEPEQFAEKRTA